jgi:superfamily II DNA or RNA helicase
VSVQVARGRGFATVADYAALPTPSAEQDLVIKAIKQGRNARVTAVAGSGKTTTILQVAKAFPERKILGMNS